MAKKIKAIKCPQCGSTKQKAIDEEHFECLNCGTEYILDSEDININHNYNYNNAPAPPINNKAIGYIFLGLIGVPLLIFLLSGLFSTTDKTIKEVVTGQKYTWETATLTQPFVDKNGKLKLFLAGDVDFTRGNGRDQGIRGQLYWGVYDLATGKMEQFNQFQDIKKEGFFSSTDFKLKKLDDGIIYYLIQESKIYAYDPKLNTFTNITNEIEQKIPQLKSGIGSVEFSYNLQALEITSNTGKKITYFPSTNLQLENFKTYNEPKVEIKEPVLTTKYAASRSNPSYIIQYNALAKSGYPVTEPNFNVQFNTNEDPTDATLASADDYSFVKNYKILNPDSRLYKLVILDYNDTNVLIAFKKSIQEGEKFHIQLLDKTGKIIWTYKSDLKSLYEQNLLTTQNEAIVSSYRNFLWIDAKGNLKKTIKLEDITFEVSK